MIDRTSSDDSSGEPAASSKDDDGSGEPDESSKHDEPYTIAKRPFQPIPLRDLEQKTLCFKKLSDNEYAQQTAAAFEAICASRATVKSYEEKATEKLEHI